MESYQKLLLANRAWASEKAELRPGYFKDLAKGQSPEFLWIGCSDSRVPAEEITGANPGEIFVHRNIANLFVHSDLNLLSVLQYAIKALKVKHIIVCGHYGCGGVNAALSNQDFGLLNKWLYHIKETYLSHREDLEKLKDEQKLDRLVELNVLAQLNCLAKTALLQKSWLRTGYPILHGLVFNLRDGLLKDIASFGPDAKLDPVHRFKLEPK